MYAQRNSKAFFPLFLAPKYFEVVYVSFCYREGSNSIFFGGGNCMGRNWELCFAKCKQYQKLKYLLDLDQLLSQ